MSGKDTFNPCIGCPAGNGVSEASMSTARERGFEFCDPNPGFNVTFGDVENQDTETLPVHVVVDGCDVDSSMPAATAQNIADRFRSCYQPIEAKKARLGGLLGSKTVLRCGAFPNQNPGQIRVRAVVSGWFNESDFL